MTISEVDLPDPNTKKPDYSLAEESSEPRSQLTELLGLWSCHNLCRELNSSRFNLVERYKVKKQGQMILDLYFDVASMSEEDLQRSIDLILEIPVKRDRGIDKIRSVIKDGPVLPDPQPENHSS